MSSGKSDSTPARQFSPWVGKPRRAVGWREGLGRALHLGQRAPAGHQRLPLDGLEGRSLSWTHGDRGRTCVADRGQQQRRGRDLTGVTVFTLRAWKGGWLSKRGGRVGDLELEPPSLASSPSCL